jgi:hypothetical protein
MNPSVVENRDMELIFREFFIYSLCFNVIILFSVLIFMDRLCDLVVRVLGYRSGGSGSIPGTTRKKK